MRSWHRARSSIVALLLAPLLLAGCARGLLPRVDAGTTVPESRVAAPVANEGDDADTWPSDVIDDAPRGTLLQAMARMVANDGHLERPVLELGRVDWPRWPSAWWLGHGRTPWLLASTGPTARLAPQLTGRDTSLLFSVTMRRLPALARGGAATGGIEGLVGGAVVVAGHGADAAPPGPAEPRTAKPRAAESRAAGRGARFP